MMFKRFVLLLGAAIGVCGFPSPTPARLFHRWSYDQLMKESDLVVVATAVKTEETGEKAALPQWDAKFVCQETTFEVKHVMKGKPPQDPVKMRQYVLAKPKEGEKPAALLNGPMLVDFKTKGYEVTVDGKTQSYTIPPQYLLYLRELRDGRYDPVAGLTDPALSVRILVEP